MNRVVATVLMPLALCLLGAAGLYAQTGEFQMANKFYDDKDYDNAIRLYMSILNQGVESAPLYFNLGNAYFKRGDLGRAILYYSKARRLAPNDEDILHNLSFARQFSRVQMAGVELNPITTFLASIVDPYRLNTLAWACSALFVLFLGAVAIRFGIGATNSPTRIGLVLSFLLLVIAAGLTTFKYRDDYLTRRAVIVAEESAVKTGPSEQSDVELEGAPGLVVEILDESGEYYDVLFENKRRGWIRKELVAEI